MVCCMSEVGVSSPDCALPSRFRYLNADAQLRLQEHFHMSSRIPSSSSPRGLKRRGPTTNFRRDPKRARIDDARSIAKQTTDAAFSNGELNVDQFIKAREFEIRALERGIRASKNVLSTRAHQELPNELRRRTASHNVKRVPKRLRNRLGREVHELVNVLRE